MLDREKRGTLLEVCGIRKGFQVAGRAVPVLDDLWFSIPTGGWTTLLGPSGCGKTTLLRILAGLIPPDAGAVERMNPRRSLQETTAYLPQSDTLLPWRTALGNAMLPLELSGAPRAEAEREAAGLLARFGLSGFEREHPHRLSGGMRQRVAIIRTFLAHREVLLLDEPLGSLDPLTRVRLQDWLIEIWSTLRKTMVLVTHDVEEALVLSDRVLLLSERPARIRESIPLSLERPRDRASHALADQKRHVFDVLLEAQCNE